MDQQNGFALFCAVVVHLLSCVDDGGAGGRLNGAIRIEFLAATHPPCAGDYRDVAVALMKLRPAHVAGVPFIEVGVGIGGGLGGITIEWRVGGGATAKYEKGGCQ